MNQLATVVPELWATARAWLQERGATSAGPPFLRYLVIDKTEHVGVEGAIPVAPAILDDGRVKKGTLPAGCYATVVHTGPYDALVNAHSEIQKWAEERGVVWDTFQFDRGTAWGARIESFLTDPTTEPDEEKWQTEIAYLVVDDDAG
jgi:effector-binding domain-containing protein